MKNIILFFFTISSVSLFSKENNSLFSNNSIEKCGTKIPSKKWENVFQSQIKEFKNNKSTNQKSAKTVITIPVIVHVIYYTNNTTQNITKAQIDSQFSILNRDFRGMSEFANNIPAVFQPLNADIEIEWCPALVDPNGNILAEPGIERISATSKGFSNPGFFGWETDYVANTVKPNTIWNPELYCNIWIVPRMRSGFNEVLGFATFPTMTTLDGIGSGNGTSTIDGVVIGAEYFGNVGSVSAPYNKGATTVHELGHWLGLRHITGDETCGNDYCDDTPTQSELSSGCPSFPQISCSNGPNGNMFMNYMDYSNDACLSMFTPDQKERMQTAMTYGNLRAPLVNSPVCYTTTPAAMANFNYNKQSAATCVTSISYDFTDNSAFNPTSWSWTFEGGTPATSTVKNPTVVFTTPGLHEVTLTATNANGSTTITKSVNVVLVGSTSLPLYENFESGNFPPFGWTYFKRSSAGITGANWDNINGVSGYGIGNYSMRYDNTTVDAYNQKDDILTPYLDFTDVTASKLKFDVAYAPYYFEGDVAFDTLEILLTDNCETTTTSIYKKGGTQLATFLPGLGEEFYPNSNQWRTDSINIPIEYLNKENVQVIFRNYGMYGHTIYIDNIYISTNNTPTVVQANFEASDVSICVGDSITFTNTSTPTGLDSVRWTIPSGSIATSNSLTTVTSQFNTAGNYLVSLVAYKNGIASTPYTTQITVKAKPTITVNSPTICAGQTATLTASGATTYSWSSSTETDNSIDVSPSATTTYTVTGTTNSCTSNPVTATVTVTNTNPIITITPSKPTAICEGETITLTASGANEYSWNTGASTNEITISPTATTTYSVTGTLTGCALSNNESYEVLVNEVPPLATITQSATSDTVFISGSSGANYNWYINGVYETSTTQPFIIATKNGVYSVKVSNSGCESNFSNTLTVTLTAIKKNNLSSNLSIFPNPNEGNFNIEFYANKTEQIHLNLYDMSGKQIYFKETLLVLGKNIFNINIQNLAKGIYTLSLVGKDGIATKPLFVK